MENTEEIVEKKLNELEIGETFPRIKLTDKYLPYALNPFYVKGTTTTRKPNDVEKLFGTHSSSSKTMSSEESDKSNKCCGKCETSDVPGLVRNTFKSKHKKKERKSFIREPRLKLIGRCVHQCALNSMKTRSFSESEIARRSEIDLSTELESHLSLQTSLENTKGTTFGDKQQNLSDFRTIIEQCSNISLTEGTASKDPKLDYSQKSFKTLRNHAPHARFRSKTPPAVSVASTSGAANSSSSSSCSQQARMQCDVTINEIASYFELLYIPKKMSSMAESMYI
ncbi:uncharacterized protein LOC134829543 [Culicoides brevitarsis]|uniref:uncharacterized protein LOC134829543 n=1 Tax=Culicoides brevitarsis TaxID=469753 RepID=UPI00307C55E5